VFDGKYRYQWLHTECNFMYLLRSYRRVRIYSVNPEYYLKDILFDKKRTKRERGL